jgi:hypothetical protein
MIKMNRYLVFFLICVLPLFGNVVQVNEEKIKDYNPNADCLVLEDEKSVICKFEVMRDETKEQQITINWISPTGEISRTREMVIPAGDTSAYDYRYLDGRENGKWDFKIIYSGKEYSTKFELQK